MPVIKLNFAGVTTIEPLPTGVYGAEIASWEMNEGPAGPYIAWTFTVVDASEFENRKLFMNTSLSDKARFKMLEFLTALGIEEGALKPEDGSDVEFDPDEMIGARLRLSVVQAKQDNGTILNNVTACLPFEEPEPVKAAIVTGPTKAAVPAKALAAAATPAKAAAPVKAGLKPGAPVRKIVG